MLGLLSQMDGATDILVICKCGRRVLLWCIRRGGESLVCVYVEGKENLEACQAHRRDAELSEVTHFFRWCSCTVSVGSQRGSLDVTRRASFLERPAPNDSGCYYVVPMPHGTL